MKIEPAKKFSGEIKLPVEKFFSLRAAIFSASAAGKTAYKNRAANSVAETEITGAKSAGVSSPEFFERSDGIVK